MDKKNPFTVRIAERARDEALKAGTIEGAAFAGICDIFRVGIEDEIRSGAKDMRTDLTLVWGVIVDYSKKAGFWEKESIDG
jgi:hypothetical protein